MQKVKLFAKTAIEVKETPDSRELKTLQKRAADIDLDESMLIGRNSPANDFDGWYWGGNVI
jgi:hypothetical protein